MAAALLHAFMHVLVVGGTGMIGRRIVPALLARGYEVTVSSRREDPKGVPQAAHILKWDTKRPFPMGVGVDVVLNVGGASLIGSRWTESYKKELWRSRVDVNRYLAAWCREVQPPPRVFITSNGANYYGDDPPGPVTEDAPPGDGFLAELCAAWENAAMEAANDATRVVSLRQGVVIDRESDAIEKLLPPFKMGVGGKVGSGRQPFPWISSHDLVRLILAVLDDDRYRGGVNAVTPGHDTNEDLTRALGSVLHRPTILPVPPFMLRVVYGESASIMTSGPKVVPARAKANGFTWDHPTLEVALRAALTKKRKGPSQEREVLTRAA